VELWRGNAAFSLEHTHTYLLLLYGISNDLTGYSTFPEKQMDKGLTRE
jgi:hypothetical protein